MKRFQDLSIATKLLGSFTAVALVAGLIGYEGVSSLHDMAASDVLLYENNTIPIALTGEISTFFQRVRVNTREMVIANDRAEIESFVGKIGSYRDSIDHYAGEFEKRILSDRMRQAFAVFVQARKAYGADLEQLILLARENKDAQAFALMKGDAAATSRMEMDAIEQLVDLKTADAAVRMEQNATESAHATVLMISFLSAGVILSLGMGLFISRSISTPVRALRVAAEKLAVGDVDVVLSDTASRDEIGQLQASFRTLIENVKAQAQTAEAIAMGDVQAQVTLRSDNDVLGKALNRVLTALRGLIAEANMLSTRRRGWQARHAR